MVSKPQQVARKRKWVFATLMSLVTVNIVIISILILHQVPASQLFDQWLSSFTLAWPIVFISILLFAPVLMRVSAWLIKDPAESGPDT